MDPYQQEYPQEETFHLRDYWQVVWKRKWLVLAVFTIIVVTTLVSSIRQKPLYMATARVLIERGKPQVLKVEEVLAFNTWQDYYETQYKILQSRSLARRVIEKLKLNEHPEFNQPPQKTLWTYVFQLRAALASVVHSLIPRPKTQISAPEPGEANDPLAPYVGAYLGRLRISPIRDSRLVDISFMGYDPVIIARIANAHARAYIERDLEMKLSASQDAVNWLGKRLKELKEKLRKSEEALQRFKEKEDIVALESLLAGGGEENIVAQKLAELNTRLTQARTERIGLETLYRQLRELAKRPGMVESIPQVIQNPLIQQLKGSLTDLTRQYSELREKYGEKHPRMVALRQEIRSLRTRIASEVKKIAKSVEVQYRVALAKEKNLKAELDRTKKEVMDLNKKAIQYGVLKREVESNRQMYDMILRRAKETSLTSGLKATNIFIVDKAVIPRVPVRPRTQRNVLLAAVIGLMLGVGLAFFLEYLDTTLHGPDDVKRHLGVPFLGPVGEAELKGGASELLVLDQPRSNFAESLRNIRTNVIFSFTEPDQNTLVVTSAGPLEGKTLISCNLAVIMAQMGRRVLLVDGDMRKPRVHKVFGTGSEPGLSNAILGRCEVEEAVRETPVKTLKIMPAGTLPPNPSEILGSRRMQELVARLKERFDFVLFDSPPLLSVTDGALLGGILDGTLLVIRAADTTRDHARRALEHLQDVRARVLGVVLNRVDFRKDRYYYSYYYKYYYYYTDEGEKRKRRIRKKTRRSSSPYGSEGKVSGT